MPSLSLSVNSTNPTNTPVPLDNAVRQMRWHIIRNNPLKHIVLILLTFGSHFRNDLAKGAHMAIEWNILIWTGKDQDPGVKALYNPRLQKFAKTFLQQDHVLSQQQPGKIMTALSQVVLNSHELPFHAATLQLLPTLVLDVRRTLDEQRAQATQTGSTAQADAPPPHIT